MESKAFMTSSKSVSLGIFCMRTRIVSRRIGIVVPKTVKLWWGLINIFENLSKMVGVFSLTLWAKRKSAYRVDNLVLRFEIDYTSGGENAERLSRDFFKIFRSICRILRIKVNFKSRCWSRSPITWITAARMLMSEWLPCPPPFLRQSCTSNKLSPILKLRSIGYLKSDLLYTFWQSVF